MRHQDRLRSTLDEQAQDNAQPRAQSVAVPVSPEYRQRMIAEAAYYLAEDRVFQGPPGAGLAAGRGRGGSPPERPLTASLKGR